jgi:predicted GNAT family acetyltransferase
MIQLAEDVFAVRNDPDQLDVNQEVIERLKKIHPSSVSEYDEGNGPVAWLLLIPTTNDLMNRFLENKITEKELFERTPLDTDYDAIYLCSAMVLEEFRRKGITKRMALTAIEEIRKDHPIKALFVWPFTKEGNLSAGRLSQLTDLPLFRHEEHK